MPRAKKSAIATLGPRPAANSIPAYLAELQVLRRHCIRSQSRGDRAAEMLVARWVGYHAGLSEADRKGIMAAAQKVRERIEAAMKREETFADPIIPIAVAKIVATNFRARCHWDSQRDEVEAAMIEAAGTLPVAPWIRDVKGVTELGLAVIVGEAQDISLYANPSRLWKRLGLACIDGSRQGYVPKDVTGTARSEAWKKRGYNPMRRAEIWAFIDNTMFKSQWRGDKDINGKDPKKTGLTVHTPAHAIGPYGLVYGERKEWNLARGLNAAHADRDARRFMAKRFIRDLWHAWHEAEGRNVAPALAA